MIKPLQSDIKIGMRVFWNDPDHNTCSGWGRVVSIQHDPVESDSIISLKMEDGGEVECLWHELSIDNLAEPLDERSYAERSKRWSQQGGI